MGCAGDMLMGALAELCDKDKFIKEMNTLGLPHVTVSAYDNVKCGIRGTKIKVEIDGKEEHEHEHEHHHHTTLQDIEQKVSQLNLPEKVRKNIIAIYRKIAEAESIVHARPVNEIHFHEVGSADAIADITGVCILMDKLSVSKIIASPINVGSGTVKCAHGILPVPAPATAHILRNIPVYSKGDYGELCTPTSAALLRHFVTQYGDMPVMKIKKIGYGMGTKDFDCANCVRAILGESKDEMEEIAELSCNLDDMTPEAIGYAQEQLFEAGAKDVYVTPIMMKKNRPATMLSCICTKENVQTVVRAMFTHTTTLGIREYICSRYTLERSVYVKDTKYGKIRIKKATGYGTEREKAEYDDIAKIAQNKGISFDKAKAYE